MLILNELLKVLDLYLLFLGLGFNRTSLAVREHDAFADGEVVIYAVGGIGRGIGMNHG